MTVWDVWVQTLTGEERAFLAAWAPRAAENGAITDAYVEAFGASQSYAHDRASKTLLRLRRSLGEWHGQGRGGDLPLLTFSWLLDLLDEIRVLPGLTDRDLTNALTLRQKLSPSDVRTYPDFTVDSLTPRQWDVYSDTARYRVLVAGRQSGKTHLAVTELIDAASSQPGCVCYFIGRTRKVVKRRPWKTLKELLPPEYIQRMSDPESHVVFRNGSELIFEGAEAIEGLRGEMLNFVVCDEFAGWNNPRAAWEGVLRPMLAVSEGRALFVSTPAGYNFLRHLYLKGENPNEAEWGSHTYTTLEGGLVSAKEVSQARKDSTNPRQFREEYEGSFEELAGRVFDYFTRDKHVPKAEDFAEAGDVLKIGIDFNLDPMSAVISQEDENGDCEVLEALCLNYSNTDELLDEIEQKYPDRTFIACPDPSGRSRHTSAGGRTDYSLIEDRPRWKISGSMYRKSIPLADKINNAQGNLQDAAGGSHVKIHPVNGAPLIEALEGLCYLEGTSQPDKSSSLDHITDAFCYLLWGEFNRFRKKATIGTFSM